MDRPRPPGRRWRRHPGQLHSGWPPSSPQCDACLGRWEGRAPRFANVARRRKKSAWRQNARRNLIPRCSGPCKTQTESLVVQAPPSEGSYHARPRGTSAMGWGSERCDRMAEVKWYLRTVGTSGEASTWRRHPRPRAVLATFVISDGPARRLSRASCVPRCGLAADLTLDDRHRRGAGALSVPTGHRAGLRGTIDDRRARRRRGRRRPDEH